MQISAKELCTMLDGRLEGDGDILIHAPAKIEEGEKGTVSFIANLKYASYASTTGSSVIIVNEDFETEGELDSTVIRVADAYGAFGIVLHHFSQKAIDKKGISKNADIHESAELGAEVYVGAFTHIEEGVRIGKGSKIFSQVYLGDQVKIGENVIIYPGVQVLHHCEIGDNTIIHSGTVIGSDGFGFAPDAEGVYSKTPQLGNVVIGKYVEIGSNTSIDRATMGSTIIGNGVKLDNLIQIAHNVEIGDHTAVASQTGISGSTKIGKHCLIGGQVGFVGHIEIADGTQINAQSGISKSIKEPGLPWNGSPAFAYKDSLKSQAIFRTLPELANRVSQLEQKLKQD